MVIDKPDEEFWSLANLFDAFRYCLLKLNHAVLSTDLCDTFDTRLKLLTILPDKNYGRMVQGVRIVENWEDCERYAGRVGDGKLWYSGNSICEG